MDTQFLGNNNREKFNAVGRRFADCTRALAKEAGVTETDAAPLVSALLLKHYTDFAGRYGVAQIEMSDLRKPA